MNIKKNITEILNLIPAVKNKIYKSPGTYMSETDTTFTGGINKSNTFNPSTDPFIGEEEKIFAEGKVIINKKD